MSEILKFKCSTEKIIAEATPALKVDLAGLRTINFNAEAKGIVGFFSFDTVANCEAAKKVIAERFADLDIVSPYTEPSKKRKQQKDKPNQVEEFFNYDRAPHERLPIGRGNGGNNGNQNGPARGRGAHGRGRGRGFRGRGRGFPNMQMIQGHVCVIDGVPFNTTNDQLAKLFCDCGQIYDINRFEQMAMIYFDKAEGVQQAIVGFNGHKLKDNVLVVSSGGTVKVPVPMAQPSPVEMH